MTVGGEWPFTVTFTGAVPTRVHTHNWSFWHSSDRGRQCYILSCKPMWEVVAQATSKARLAANSDETARSADLRRAQRTDLSSGDAEHRDVTPIIPGLDLETTIRPKRGGWVLGLRSL